MTHRYGYKNSGMGFENCKNVSKLYYNNYELYDFTPIVAYLTYDTG